jgi:hypothetical protein
LSAYPAHAAWHASMVSNSVHAPSISEQYPSQSAPQEPAPPGPAGGQCAALLPSEPAAALA